MTGSRKTQKALKLLIKLSKNELDQVQSAIIKLREEQEHAAHHLLTLEQILEEERILAEQQPNMRHFFQNYETQNVHQQKDIRTHLAQIEMRYQSLQEQLHKHYQEKKTYEIALEQLKTKMFEEAKYREQQQLDETAVLRFTRSKIQ